MYLDNSGSMALHENRVVEVTVFLMELLRKLECRFAVARFGDTGVVLKHFDDPFAAVVGERVIHAMTYDTSTHPHASLDSVAKALWPSTKPANVHRCVIMVTDGVCSDLARDHGANSFIDLKTTYGFLLGVEQLALPGLEGQDNYTRALRTATDDLFVCADGERCDTMLELMMKLVTMMCVAARVDSKCPSFAYLLCSYAGMEAS